MVRMSPELIKAFMKKNKIKECRMTLHSQTLWLHINSLFIYKASPDFANS